MKRILVLSVSLLFLFSCELTVNEDITSQYLVDGMANSNLDVYLQNNQVFRYKGKPGIVTIPVGNPDLSDYESCFVLYVSKGSDPLNAVSKVIVKLDGLEVLSNDFSIGPSIYDFEICDLTPVSVMTVEVKGEPGSYIEIWIEGKKKCFECGDILIDERDGHEYKTVKIGNQCWMAENLNYNEGISSTTYDNDPSYAEKYGRMYTWDVALNVCPTGWHLPSHDEWKDLERYLGMSESELDIFDIFRGTDEGGKLKEAGNENWIAPNLGATNETGFTALPGGYYSLGESRFLDIGSLTFFWSSSLRPPYDYQPAVARGLGTDYGGINLADAPKSVWYYVRCMKD
jgi:uncharacterized protein (TIGR02145 family)